MFRATCLFDEHGKGVDYVSVAPDGRRMLRIEARNAQTPIERKPDWIRTPPGWGRSTPGSTRW